MRVQTIRLVMRTDRKKKMQLSMMKKRGKKRKKKKGFLLKKISLILKEMVSDLSDRILLIPA
jgi:hypothetical protein